MIKNRILSGTRLHITPNPLVLTAPQLDCYDENAGWSSLVARWAHNPKVGGSNPPPATNLIIGLQAKLLFPARAKRGIIGCFGGLFHFASLSAGRRTLCTTFLLAA